MILPATHEQKIDKSARPTTVLLMFSEALLDDVRRMTPGCRGTSSHRCFLDTTRKGRARTHGVAGFALSVDSADKLGKRVGKLDVALRVDYQTENKA